jgi:hypothetical protein
LTKEPKDSPACVDDGVGIFVSPTGADTAVGTKSSPVRTIAKALELAGAKRVYVCEGTYAENVEVKGGGMIAGGFACADWRYTGVKAKVVPAAGHALRVTKASGEVVVSDLELVSVDAAANSGESSVAVFASESAGLTLLRAKVEAGKGADAPLVEAPVTNMYGGDKTGKGATGNVGGGSNNCACPVYGASVGASGGNGGNAAVKDGKPGDPGGAAPATPPPSGVFDGKGGMGAADPGGNCTPGTAGAAGEARTGGKGAVALGTLTAQGWAPAAGTKGEAGGAGQGGGGGGGDNFTNGAGGGGGGGCGGCGGNGAAGGRGGGASIAVLSFNTALKLEGTTLKTRDAGRGADGGTGEAGGGGGGGTVGACAGRAGGPGAGGSGGGGGAGGVSVGILYAGAKPRVDGSEVASAATHPTATLGQHGLHGTKGSGGAANMTSPAPGNAGNEGTDGVAGEAAAVKGL